MNSCLVRPPEAASFLAQGKPAKEAPLAGRKETGSRSRCPVDDPNETGPLRLGSRSGAMEKGWFNVWSALALTLALLGTPLRAEFAYVANRFDNNVGVHDRPRYRGAHGHHPRHLCCRIMA
jgi:hypothetical protein